MPQRTDHYYVNVVLRYTTKPGMEDAGPHDIDVFPLLDQLAERLGEAGDSKVEWLASTTPVPPFGLAWPG